ncbi:hypothetical protein EXS72_00360 [Candidatus Pacearchaeota archaeon]|nr:hypothetical protein [Candidatus Pacearchaeota archaeon]
MINLQNKLVKYSIIFLFLVGLFNILNFLYHIIMARMLSIEDFGLLKRVFAFLYIGAIFMEAIQIVVVKYASTPREDKGKLKNIFLRVTKGLIKPTLVVMIIFLFLSIFISPILKIPYALLLTTSLFIICSMFIPISRGILQGQQRFWALGFSMISEAGFKIIFAFLLVYFGFGVFGAIWGVIISIILSLLLSLIYLKNILKSKSSFIELKDIRAYSKPVFMVTLVLILFLNIDILLAGYFFDQMTAGIYAIASTISLIIFIGIQPINKVLFPLTVHASTRESPPTHNFKRAIILILLLCTLALITISLFTEEIIYLISKKVVTEAVLPTIILAIGTTFLSLSSAILYYKLSQGKKSHYQYILIFLIIEIILLCTFSQTLVTYAFAFLVSNILLFIGSLMVLRK